MTTGDNFFIILFYFIFLFYFNFFVFWGFFEVQDWFLYLRVGANACARNKWSIQHQQGYLPVVSKTSFYKNELTEMAKIAVRNRD